MSSVERVDSLLDAAPEPSQMKGLRLVIEKLIVLLGSEIPAPGSQQGRPVLERQIVVARIEGPGLENIRRGIEFGKNGNSMDSLIRRFEFVVWTSARIDEAVGDELACVVEYEHQLVAEVVEIALLAKILAALDFPQRAVSL